MNVNLKNELTSEKIIWTITNFNRIPKRVGISFKGSIIHQGNARKVWRCFLYPSGKYDKNYVSVYFAKAYRLFDPIIYHCSMTIADTNGNPLKSFVFPYIDFEISSIGGNECFRTDSFEKLRIGPLTIQSEITELSEKSLFPSRAADFENLSKDLTVLLQNTKYSDLIVSIQQYQFYLHKCILYARARRLSHLFGYQSFNEMPKVVRINSIPPCLFQQLMFYLYSGKLTHSNCLLELFKCADQLKLQSFKQCVYEKVQEHRTETEIATQTVTIRWNLEEIRFREKGTVPFVQLFHATCCINRMAVRMGISEHTNGEKYIDVSFRIFLETSSNLVSVLCVMTLYFNGKIIAYKNGSHNIEPNEEWHFPPFIKLSDIPENCDPCFFLVAEVSLSDGCPAYNNLYTKTRLFTQNETVTYPEHLGNDIRRLLSPNLESRYKNCDVSIKSADNCCIPAHKAILFARWPAIREHLLNHNEQDSYMQLNISTKEIEILLNYLYTGSLASSDCSIAKDLLKVGSKLDLPPYLEKKCQYILEGKII